MRDQRLVGFLVLLSFATACAPAMQRHALAPQRGPKASIHASWTGGITNRFAQARFAVESDAYALVGHLGGDGYIRILYPESSNERGVVEKGKSYKTGSVYARNDAIPSLYQARMVHYRHVAARMDSYDGGGNGYFFLITSRYPLDFSAISVGDFFDEIEVPDYYNTYDPRLTIKALGDLVSRGSPYTLEFATSFGSMDYSNFVDYNADCLTLSMFSFGFARYAVWTQPFYYVFGSRGLRNALSCGSRYASGISPFASSYYGRPTVVPAPPPLRPRGTIRPPWRRVAPGQRARGGVSSRAYLPERIARRAGSSSGRTTYRPSDPNRPVWSERERARPAGRGSSSATPSNAAPVRESPAARQADRHTERATAERTRSEGTRQPSPSTKKDP